MQNGGPSVAETETGVSRLSVDANGSDTAIQSDAGAIVPVGKVQSVSLPAPNLDGVRSVDTHTRDVGVIQPPPDLKVIIDKTATFVARNGEHAMPCLSFSTTQKPSRAFWKGTLAICLTPWHLCTSTMMSCLSREYT